MKIVNDGQPDKNDDASNIALMTSTIKCEQPREITQEDIARSHGEIMYSSNPLTIEA